MYHLQKATLGGTHPRNEILHALSLLCQKARLDTTQIVCDSAGCSDCNISTSTAGPALWVPRKQAILYPMLFALKKKRALLILPIASWCTVLGLGFLLGMLGVLARQEIEIRSRLNIT